MFLKKGVLFFAALALLVFAGKAEAGPYASSVIGMDIVTAASAANSTDDKVLAATATGTTAIVVELFTTPTAGAVNGADILFDLDPAVVQVTGFAQPSGFFTLGTTQNSAQIGALPGTLSAAGYWGAVTFTPQVSVTGVEFSIGITRFVVAAAAGGTDTLRTTQRLVFNAQPKLTTNVTGIVTIPRGGQATATVTASGFAAGATITFNVTKSGSATITESQSGSVLTLTASGSGAGSASVTATDGTTTTGAVVIQFDQQVPVELAAFGGELVENQVVLNWTTASQTNNAGFRVLRSTDQENYEVVSDIIAGAGTTDALMNYSFNDGELPSAEQVFYVLEQIDLDGTVHRSNPIEVILGARFVLPTEFASAVFPNPFNPSTTISYDLPAEAQVSIVIYDAIGQEVRQLVNKSHAAGRYSVQWDAKDQIGRNVGSGVYIAKIKAGTFSSTQKMLLLK
jgi:hypothetical protein